jgi:hypothetical protein
LLREVVVEIVPQSVARMPDFANSLLCGRMPPL